MPDFKALSSLFGAAADLLKGLTGALGSVAGDGITNAWNGISGISSGAK